MYMFGGTIVTFGQVMNDLYVLDLKSLEWKNLTQSSTNIPSRRASMSCSTYGKERLYVFGGTEHFRLNDLWEYQISKLSYSKHIVDFWLLSR